MTSRLTRRALVQGAAVVGASLVVSGCGDDGSPTTTDGDPTAAGTTPSTPQPLAAVADIAVGKAVSAESPDGKPLILARTSQTEVVGFSAVCPHQRCTVAPSTDKLACPCHGSTFATTTGERLGGPAPTGLSPFAVRVANGSVFPA